MNMFGGDADRSFHEWDNLRRQVEARGDVIVNRKRHEANKELLHECLVELRHCAVFVRTREKLAPVGVEQYDDLVKRLSELV